METTDDLTTNEKIALVLGFKRGIQTTNLTTEHKYWVYPKEWQHYFVELLKQATTFKSTIYDRKRLEDGES